MKKLIWILSVCFLSSCSIKFEEVAPFSATVEPVPPSCSGISLSGTQVSQGGTLIATINFAGSVTRINFNGVSQENPTSPFQFNIIANQAPGNYQATASVYSEALDQTVNCGSAAYEITSSPVDAACVSLTLNKSVVTAGTPIEATLTHSGDVSQIRINGQAVTGNPATLSFNASGNIGSNFVTGSVNGAGGQDLCTDAAYLLVNPPQCVSVTPNTTSVQVGQTVELQIAHSGYVTSLDINGTAVANPNSPHTWVSPPLNNSGQATFNVSVGSTELSSSDACAPVNIQVNDPPSSDLTISPSSHDFGNVLVGSTDSHLFTLSNAGSSEITSLAPSIAAPFSISSNNCPATLGVGVNCTIMVDFSPSSEGSVGQNLTFSFDGNPDLIVPLSGAGVPAPVLQLTADASSHDYGSVKVGSTVSHTFLMTNSGNQDLSVRNYSLSAPFVAGSNCPNPIPVGQSCEVTVNFSPTMDVSYDQDLVITYGSGENSDTMTINLLGQGAAILSASAVSHDFGSLTTGETQNASIVLSNIGSVQVEGISVDSLPDPFSASDDCDTLQPSQTCTISISFSPTAAGSYSETIDVDYEVTGGEDFSFEITIDGEAQDATAAPFTSGTSFNGKVNVIDAKGPDGIYVGGEFTMVNGLAANRIVRLTHKGEVDDKFTTGSGFDGKVNSIFYAPLGKKIIVGGDFQTYNGQTAKYLVRLNPNGSLDNSFNPNVLEGGEVRDIVAVPPPQDTYQIYIAGDFLSHNGNDARHLIRINSDGSQDTDFDPDNGFESGKVYSVYADPSGRVYAGGSFLGYNGTTAFRIIRLLNDASVDNSFSKVIIGDSVRKIIGAGGGDIYVAGVQLQFIHGVTDIAKGIARIKPDGTYHSFRTQIVDGVGNAAASVYDIELDAGTGELLVAGDFDGVATGPPGNITFQAAQNFTRIGSNGLPIPGNTENLITGPAHTVERLSGPDRDAVVGGMFSPGNLAKLSRTGVLE